MIFLDSNAELPRAASEVRHLSDIDELRHAFDLLPTGKFPPFYLSSLFLITSLLCHLVLVRSVGKCSPIFCMLTT